MGQADTFCLAQVFLCSCPIHAVLMSREEKIKAMKKWGIILCVLALTAIVLSATLATSEATRSSAKDDDPDIPRTWKTAMSKEEYMLRREEHVALMRGIGTGLPFDPLARIQAIQELEEQQSRLLGTT